MWTGTADGGRWRQKRSYTWNISTAAFRNVCADSPSREHVEALSEDVASSTPRHIFQRVSTFFFMWIDTADGSRWHRRRNYTWDIFAAAFRNVCVDSPNRTRENTWWGRRLCASPYKMDMLEFPCIPAILPPSLHPGFQRARSSSYAQPYVWVALSLPTTQYSYIRFYFSSKLSKWYSKR